MKRKTVYCPIWKVIALLCSHCVWQHLLCLVLSFAVIPMHHQGPAGSCASRRAGALPKPQPAAELVQLASELTHIIT